MGNCGTKPKTSGDDTPAPVEPQTAAGPAAAEGERNVEEVPAPEGTSQAVVAPQSEEATTTIVEEKEHAEPEEKQEIAKEDTDHGKEKETPTTTEEAAEPPASTPASVA